MESPFFVLESPRSFSDTCSALEQAVPAHGFGMLGSHDLGHTLRSKGQAFGEECRVFELCQPQQAAQVLAAEMQLSTALPCRVSVYTDGGRTKVAMVRPEGMLRLLSSNPALAAVAGEVEATTVAIIREAVGQP
jgi:uncharacterized protein (DUF302 family)